MCLSHIIFIHARPSKQLSVFAVGQVFFKPVSFAFEWIFEVGLIVTFSPDSSSQIKPSIKYPMKNEQKLQLLPEVDHFVIKKYFFLLYAFPAKDENEK